MYDQHTGRKASESMHSGQRQLKLKQKKKLQIAWLNLYGSIGFLSTRGFATRA